MKRAVVLIACAAMGCAIPTSVTAQEEANFRGFPAEPQLSGVERDEAKAIVAQLEQAQAALRAGGTPSFSLFSGAPAYYDAANLGPRDAFLALDWSKTLWVKAEDKGNFSRAYRLEILPNGFGKLVWDVRVWLRASGEIERIELYNHPPPPF